MYIIYILHIYIYILHIYIYYIYIYTHRLLFRDDFNPTQRIGESLSFLCPRRVPGFPRLSCHRRHRALRHGSRSSLCRHGALWSRCSWLRMGRFSRGLLVMYGGDRFCEVSEQQVKMADWMLINIFLFRCLALFSCFSGLRNHCFLLGHPAGAISTAWFLLVWPCLTLQYLGQAVVIAADPQIVQQNPLYNTVTWCQRFPTGHGPN